MPSLGLSSKYGRRHGEELRKEKRTFARETAETLAEVREAEAVALAESRMAELERTETGATRRAKLKEAGLGRRLGREQEYARPGQEAEIRRLGAETEEVSYGTEFERGARGTLEDILKTRRREAGAGAREAELGVSEMERDIRLRREAEASARIRTEEAEKEAARPPTSAKPGRTMRPGLKRALWEGTPTRSGLTLPGLGAPLYGYKNIADWLGAGMKKGYEYAFPRTR